MDMSQEFAIKRASNGGLIVQGKTNGVTPWGADASTHAAFSTPADMLAWLAEQYGVKLATGGVIKPFAAQIRRMGEVPSEQTVSVTADDVCTNWVAHNGGFADVLHGVPCMIRMREGDERVGKTWDNPGRWNWAAPNVALSDFDVIAYRLI